MLRWLAIAVVMTAGPSIGAAHAAGGLKIVVIVDNSGSMNASMPGGGTRITAAKQSLLTVLSQTPADAEAGVVLLNPTQNGRWLVPLGPVDAQAMTNAVNSLRAGGPTPLGAAMKVAADELLAARDAQRYGAYKLLIVTDGEATDRTLVERHLPQIQKRGLLVDVIGVAMGSRHSLATRSNTYRSADDPASLQKAISAVVLGESAADGSDAGESDFELLAAIPGELAAAALDVLTEKRNTPIDSQTNNQGAAFPPANAPATAQGAPPVPGSPAAQGPAPEQGDTLFGKIIVFIFLAIVFRSVIGLLKKR